MKLAELVSSLDYQLLQGSLDTEVTEVENDSRKDICFSVSAAASGTDIPLPERW